ncbi:hypothetical protein TWF481_004343 [Arthrobotrys musiformis]|uniref:Fe2OG dioxygenase domain-containing protein n=1 Tax=Arthrobotrys musiformis TaxID=47236 RepID=A0AAV9WQ08_9PEZI
MSNTETTFHPLETYKIPTLPPSAYYIPSFLSPSESTELLSQISTHPWTTLTHRRLQPHPAPLTPSGHLLTSKPLPKFLESIASRLLSLKFSDETGIFTTSPHGKPNHVLINEYPPSTGIPSHEDGAAYFPVVCTVSLSSHIVLEVTPKNGGGGYRIFQEPESLLVTTEEVYREHLHGIEAVEVDGDLSEGTVANWGSLSDEVKRRILEGGGEVRREGVRISLTYRDVIKVKDAGRLFGRR